MKSQVIVSETFTLRYFLREKGLPFTPDEAVSLLMPVAAELRRLHETGNAYPGVSPDSVVINGGKASLLPPDEGRTRKAAPGCIPPECRGGGNPGVKADIYSFCAVLRFAFTGREPAETPAEAEDASVPEGAYAALLRITARGMEPEPEARYASMQELIYALIPFNTGAAAIPAAQSGEGPAPAVRKKTVWPAVAAVIAAALLLSAF